jgi:hypothetical protein
MARAQPQARQLQQVMLSALLIAVGLCAAVVILSARDLQRRPSELIQVRYVAPPPSHRRSFPAALVRCPRALPPGSSADPAG